MSWSVFSDMWYVHWNLFHQCTAVVQRACVKTLDPLGSCWVLKLAVASIQAVVRSQQSLAQVISAGPCQPILWGILLILLPRAPATPHLLLPYKPAAPQTSNSFLISPKYQLILARDYYLEVIIAVKAGLPWWPVFLRSAAVNCGRQHRLVQIWPKLLCGTHNAVMDGPRGWILQYFLLSSLRHLCGPMDVSAGWLCELFWDDWGVPTTSSGEGAPFSHQHSPVPELGGRAQISFGLFSWEQLSFHSGVSTECRTSRGRRHLWSVELRTRGGRVGGGWEASGVGGLA